MRVTRRSFVSILAAAAAAVADRRAAARDATEALDVHRATRNTRMGALGVRLPRLSGPPAPFKPYPGEPRVPLPAPLAQPAGTLRDVVRSWTEDARAERDTLTLAELARLLYFANGITEPGGGAVSGLRRRAAPSAGALYSGEVYVVAGAVAGLAPGVHYYDVARHALAPVREGALLPAVVSALESGEARGGAAAVLLTHVFGRYTWRYANRGYRYALIDTGHIAENLRLSAASAGLRERACAAFEDDRLNALLGVDGLTEAVCGVHLIGDPGRAGVTSAELEERSDAPASPSGARLVERGAPAAELDPGARVTERFHSASALVRAASGAGAGERPARARAAPPVSRPSIALPRASARLERGMTLEEAIRIRRSARAFRRDPIDLAQLGYVLEMAVGDPALARTPGIELHLVVHRVAGLRPGHYRVAPGHRLVALAASSASSPDWERELVRACLGQQNAGRAALGCVMVAPLGPRGEDARRRRYRDLLIESGAIGQRIYLAAESIGLTARNLAAYVDDRLNALLALDGHERAAVHLTMLGPGD